MCPQCRAFITSDDKICPYCDTKQGARAVDRRLPDALLGGLLPADRMVTMLLLMVNTALYAATLIVTLQSGGMAGGGGMLGIGTIDSATLTKFGANVFLFVNAGQWWRLVTAGFLHISLIHVAMNMWSLFSIGAMVEEIFGTSRMTAIWIVSTITGFGASFYINHGFSAGASAGLFGLIGAMIAFGVQHKTSAFAQAAKSAFLQTAAINLVIGFMGYFPIDNWAHIGGLAGGFGVAMLSGIDNKDGGLRDRVWHWVSIACILLTAFSFWKAVQFSGALASLRSL